MYDTTNSSFSEIPTVILANLIDYGKNGTPLGGFLEAVVTNDLAQAVFRADVDNLPVLKEILWFVWNEMPHGCHGSKEIVEEWRFHSHSQHVQPSLT